MVRYSLYLHLLLWLVISTRCENLQKQAEDKLDKVILQKSEPYINNRKDNQSFLSRVANWIFPNKKDLVPAEGKHGGYHYLPPPHGHDDRDCNSCNFEPWVPIVGHNKINFIPNKDFSSPFSNVHSIDSSNLPNNVFNNPSGIYEVPNVQYGPPKPIYDPPKLDYGPPPKPDYGPPPKPYYGPPLPEFSPPKPSINNHFSFPNTGGDLFIPEYMLPPPINFKIPPVLYGPSKHIYRPSSGSSFGPPPKDNYGPPPKPGYGPPKPNYGPPNPEYGPPKPNYGPPMPPYVLHGVPPISQNNLQEFLIPPAQSIKSTILQPVPSGFGDVPYSQDSVSPDFVPPPPPTVNNFHPERQQPNHQIDNSQSSHVLGNIPLESNYIPQPVPSDSYGNPVTDDHLGFNPSYDSLPAPSGDSNDSNDYVEQRFPVLNPLPVPPRYEYTDFRQGDTDNVQIQKSVKVADYLASIEHPINVVQSPLVEVEVNENPQLISYNRIAKTHHEDFKKEVYSPNNIENGKLSENPIVVDDSHTAASSINTTVASPNSIQNKRDNDRHLASPTTGKSKEELIQNFLTQHGLVGNSESKPIKNKNTTFLSPSLDYNDWIPKYQQSGKIPPPSWVPHGTQKPKQIIIPYTKNPDNVKSILESYTTLVPVYTPPMPTQQSDWSKYLNDIETTRLTKVAGRSFSTSSTAVYNINDLIAANTGGLASSPNLPYDIITLQKSIDSWTHQSFSKGKLNDSVHHKQIPEDYFTTKISVQETTPSNDIFDHHSAESSRKETISEETDINSNLIVAAETRTPKSSAWSTTPKPNSVKDFRSSWRAAHVTVSPHTKEKVYVVTPQAYSFVTASPAISWSMAPKVQNGTEHNVTRDARKFSVRIEPQIMESKQKIEGNQPNLKVVYSEWPHLINNLQTTSPRPTSAHPLFGLMGISAYTPPPNSTVETFFGHSKVITVVTPVVRETSTKSSIPKTSN